MERPVFKPAGTPAEELDTPALVVQLEALEENIERVHGFFRGSRARLRPHVEAHRCPAIAHKQLAAGGTVGGISVATVGEAEVFAESGLTDILVSHPVVTRQKMKRLCALGHHARIRVAVDDPANARDLSEAARAAGVRLDVVLAVRTRLPECGVEAGPTAAELARLLADLPGLSFEGLVSRHGAPLPEDPLDLPAESRKWIQQVLDTRELLERAGLKVNGVGLGGTLDYEVAGAMPGVTEVHAGTYALMDHRHARYHRRLKPAARVLSTVTSRPEPEVVIVDAGHKATASDAGFPAPDASGLEVVGLSAEHGRLRLTGGAAPRVGDKLWLVPFDSANCVNVYDYIFAVRGGKLEVVWQVAARGHYR